MPKKKWLLCSIITVLLIVVFLLVYLLPITRSYFLPGEQIELQYIVKTTLHVPEGTTVERYGPVDYSDEDILENEEGKKLSAKMYRHILWMWGYFSGNIYSLINSYKSVTIRLSSRDKYLTGGQ